jgi:Secretion system C-terminal sorting domain
LQILVLDLGQLYWHGIVLPSIFATMKRFAILSLLSLSLISSVVAQGINLISNGDFEAVSPIPSAQGQLASASGWSNCNGFTTWPYGSPDLFHTGASGSVRLPNTIAGTVAPYQGSAVAGFITSNGVVPNFREYLSYPLSEPLVPGQSYTFEFYLTNGTGNYYGNRGSNGIGAAFTMTQPTQVTQEPLPLVPQVEITTVTHHADWRRYSFTFTPTQAFQQVTIGNFRNDANTTWSTFVSAPNPIAYYFIDMASVTLTTPLNNDVVRLRRTEKEDVIELAWHKPADADGDQFILERSLDQVSFSDVHDFGQGISANADLLYTDTEALPGLTYYYRLRNITLSGDVKLSPIVEASYGDVVKYVAGEVYPNPTANHFSLDFAAAVEGNLNMDIIDGTGRIVYTESQQLAVGQANPSYQLPEGIAAGVYQVRFQFGGEMFTKRLIVAGQI